MRWGEIARAIEPLEDLPLDPELMAACAEPDRASGRPIRFSTPSFRAYSGSEIEGCTRNSFPAFSVTGAACALDCDHCQAKILAPMIPAGTPQHFERAVRDLVALQGLRGFLLSGGSNRRNEIAYEPFLPAVERLKRDFPYLQIAVHTGLLDRPRARALAASGIGTAMMDVIGDEATIRDVYHLDRPAADFAATLDALCESGLAVVPHIVVGLHYGRILGEPAALAMVADRPVAALVLVVVMPHYARPGSFATPDAAEVGRVFVAARAAMGGRQVLLGCARPPGRHKRMVDAYAVMAGLDGIAFPADGAVELARALGRPVDQAHACCSIAADGPGAALRACA